MFAGQKFMSWQYSLFAESRKNAVTFTKKNYAILLGDSLIRSLTETSFSSADFMALTSLNGKKWFNQLYMRQCCTGFEGFNYRNFFQQLRHFSQILQIGCITNTYISALVNKHSVHSGGVSRAQLFQLLGEMLNYYNRKLFSSQHFGFRSFGKLTFGLNTLMI